MHKFAAHDFRGIGGESVQEKPPYGVKNVSSDITSDIDLRHGLEFILGHFAASHFPRTISTRTTEGRQVTVNNKEEALARLKQSNYLDCRINAYSGGDIKGDPNFIFIDIDSTNPENLDKIIDKKLSRFSAIGGHPTVLFTGSGFHIYQPIGSICLDDLQEFSSFPEPSKQFLKFAEKYLSYGKSDPDHNPSFKSCMVRVPGSINSKNGERVKIVQEWDGHRPSIALMIGSFQLWLATKQKKEEAKFAKISNTIIESSPGNSAPRKIEWIEILLKTPLDDYRKTIVNLVLAPYLINIRQLEYQAAFDIIKSWLERCASLRKLGFGTESLTGNALATASKTGYKPMRLDTLKQRNAAVYRELKLI